MRVGHLAWVPVMLLLSAPGAAAAPAADSTRLARMSAASADLNRFRVLSTLGRYDLQSLRADTAGVDVDRPVRRPALLMNPNLNPVSPRRILWAEIERIDGTRSHAIRGFTEGAIVGGIVGLSVGVLMVADSHSESLAPLGALPLGVLLGGFLGASLGSASGWTALYP